MPDFFLDEAFISFDVDKPAEKVEDLSVKVNGIMEVIQKSLSTELVQTTQAVYQFNTKGNISLKILLKCIIYFTFTYKIPMK